MTEENESPPYTRVGSLDSQEQNEAENGGYTLPRKVLFAVGLTWMVLGATMYILPSRYSFYIAIAFVSLSGISSLYLLYQARDNDELRAQLEDFVDSKWWGARKKVNKRLPLAGILLIMLMLQLIIANEALPKQKAKSLASLIEVGSIDVGIFTMIAFLIFTWLLGPLASYFVERGYNAVRVSFND